MGDKEKGSGEGIVPNFVKKESGSILSGKGSWWFGHTHFCRNYTPLI